MNKAGNIYYNALTVQLFTVKAHEYRNLFVFHEKKLIFPF